MKRFPIRLLAFAGFLLATGPLAAAVNLFIKLSDVSQGESLQKDFAGANGWSELGACSWSISADSSWTKGGGASVGKPTSGSFKLTRRTDVATPAILKDITSGNAVDTIEIAALKTTGSATPEMYLHFVLTRAYYTRIEQSMDDSGAPTETVEFVYKTIKVEYKPQDPWTGKLGPAKTFNWDIPAGAVGG